MTASSDRTFSSDYPYYFQSRREPTGPQTDPSWPRLWQTLGANALGLLNQLIRAEVWRISIHPDQSPEAKVAHLIEEVDELAEAIDNAPYLTLPNQAGFSRHDAIFFNKIASELVDCFFLITSLIQYYDIDLTQHMSEKLDFLESSKFELVPDPSGDIDPKTNLVRTFPRKVGSRRTAPPPTYRQIVERRNALADWLSQAVDFLPPFNLGESR